MMSLRNVSVPYIENSNNGIVRYIAFQHNVNNAFDRNLIDIFYDSHSLISGPPQCLFNIKGSDWWGTDDEPTDHWITVDFFSYRVSVKSYGLLCSEKHYHRNWTLFSSNDNITWTPIHNSILENPPETSRNYFNLDTPSNPSRFIKYQTHSSRFDDKWDMALGYLEFFGTLSYSVPMCSIKKKTTHFLHMFFTNVFIIKNQY